MANIQKRGDNSYFFTVYTGRGADGKYDRETKTITVEQQLTPKKLQEFVEAEYMKFKQEVKAGTYIAPGKKTFKEFISMWRDNYAISNLSPTTLEVYNAHIESRLTPTFGHKMLDQITPGLILDFLKALEKPGARLTAEKTTVDAELTQKPLDIGTIGYIYRVLKNIFTRAVEWKLIASNPMDGIKKPVANNEAKKKKQLDQKNNPQFYNDEEAQAVVDALYNEPEGMRESEKSTLRRMRLFVLGSMIGGCRRGELVGLGWPSVHFDEHSISIENNIPLTKSGAAVEKDPKSLSSIRTIDMPEWYMTELEQYYQEWLDEKEKIGDLWEGGNRQFVFHSGEGKPYYYKHPSRWWERFCKRQGIRYIKFHGLRHSMGTLLIEDEDESQIDHILMAIQKRLGHSRLGTTTDIYVHLTKKVKKRTTGKFDKFARKAPDPTLPIVETEEQPRLIRIK